MFDWKPTIRIAFPWMLLLVVLADSAAGQGQPVRQPTYQPRPQRANAPFPALSPEEQRHLQEILSYWERRSNEIERYRSQFQRWEYDSVYGPTDQNVYKTYAEGSLEYASPDKGLYHVQKLLFFTPPPANKPGERPQYLERKSNNGEVVQGDHWVCDGQAVYQFKHATKQLLVNTLPPDMQGKSITNGPLPFMFGAKAAEIQERYWMRVITPREVANKKEWWLEAWPKRPDDAANFQRVWIIIDGEEFLPKSLQIFDRAYNERSGNFSRTVFVFKNREVNWNDIADKLLVWKNRFRPKVPAGWVQVDEAAASTAQPTNTPRAANRIFGLPRIRLFGRK